MKQKIVGVFSCGMMDNINDYLDFAVRNAYLHGLTDSEQEGANVLADVFLKLRRNSGAAWTKAPVCIKQNILWGIKSRVRKEARRERLCPHVSIESSMDKDMDENSRGNLLDRIAIRMRDFYCECPSHMLVLKELLALALSSMGDDRKIFMAMADSKTGNNLIFAARRLGMNPCSLRTHVYAFRKLFRKIVNSGKAHPDVKSLRRLLRKQHDAALNGGGGPTRSRTAETEKRGRK